MTVALHRTMPAYEAWKAECERLALKCIEYGIYMEPVKYEADPSPEPSPARRGAGSTGPRPDRSFSRRGRKRY